MASISFAYIANAAEHVEVTDGKPLPMRPAPTPILWTCGCTPRWPPRWAVLYGEEFDAAVNLRSGRRYSDCRALEGDGPDRPFWFSNADQQLKSSFLIHATITSALSNPCCPPNRPGSG
ncbi:MAG: hypothetical protein R2911_43640 [Caldilineaceae bacterium]